MRGENGSNEEERRHEQSWARRGGSLVFQALVLIDQRFCTNVPLGRHRAESPRLTFTGTDGRTDG